MFDGPIDDTDERGLHAAQRPLRIAFVTETYPPEINGVAMSVARLVENLHARGHHLQLIRPRQSSAGEVEVEAEAEAEASVRFEDVLTGAWPIPRYAGLRMGAPSRHMLSRLWSARRPDVVHIATEGPLGWSAMQAARQLKLPVTADFRTNFHAYGKHYRMSWLARPIDAYLRAFHNLAHCTMVPTEALRRQLAARGFERLCVVGRGVDTRLFDPRRRNPALRRHWGAQPEDLVVASVGRLAPEKNLAVVLKAYEGVRQLLPSARLLLVGEGPLREHLRAHCPSAHFAGQRRSEDLAAHYASADLFLIPSLTETYGNVTAEAMASGLPVLAFDCAAAAELIRPGRNGILVVGADGDDYERAAMALAADPQRRAAIGAAARASVLGRGWDSVVQNFEALLVQAVDAPAAGPGVAWTDTPRPSPMT